jgi:hypothetical protein
MEKLALKSRVTLYKSCRVIHKETNKIGFAFFLFFLIFYRFTRFSQNTLEIKKIIYM